MFSFHPVYDISSVIALDQGPGLELEFLPGAAQQLPTVLDT